MKALISSLLLVLALPCNAGEPLSIGKGHYQLSARGVTVFASQGGLEAKLLRKANEFCAKRGKEAVLLDTRGADGMGGIVSTASTAIIQFTCEDPS